MEPDGDGEEKERDVAGAERVLPALLSRKKKRKEEKKRARRGVRDSDKPKGAAAEIT